MTEVKHGNNAIAYHFIKPKSQDASKGNQEDFQMALNMSSHEQRNSEKSLLSETQPANIMIEPSESAAQTAVSSTILRGHYSTPAALPIQSYGQGIDIRV